MKTILYTNILVKDNFINLNLNVGVSYHVVKNSYMKDLIDVRELTKKLLLEDYEIDDLFDVGEKDELIFLELEDYKYAECFKHVYDDVCIIKKESDLEDIIRKYLKFVEEDREVPDDIVNEDVINTESNLEKILGVSIDKVFCISIKQRRDRQIQMEKQMKMLQQSFSFVKVEKHKDPVRGCLESHKYCIQQAKNKGYKNVLILEDDAIFNMKLLQTLLSNNIDISVPKDFDMLYLGYTVNDGYKHDDFLLKILSAQCLHAYIVNEKIYDEVLDNIEKDWTTFPEWNTRNEMEKQINFDCRAVDLFYGKIINQRLKNSYGVFPILCTQQVSHSDIENKVVDYSKVMINKSVHMFSKYKYGVKKYLINLERRTDRLKKLNTHEFSTIMTGVAVYKAIDGRTFNFESIKSLFDTSNYSKSIKNPYNNHQYSPGVLGCALSHYLLWQKALEAQEDYTLILEDDITLCSKFIHKFNAVMDDLQNLEWDVVFLGFTDYKNVNDKKITDRLIKFSPDKRLNGGGTFGYVITKMGAKKLLEIAEKEKIQQAVDWFMIEQFDKLNCYKCEPELIFSPLDTDGSGDIQHVKKIEEKKEEMEEKKEGYNPPKYVPPKLTINVGDYKEVIINNSMFFMNDNKFLIKPHENDMLYYGQFVNGKLERGALQKQMVKPANLLTEPTKETIMLYSYNDVPYHFRKMAEKLTERYNVIVMSKNCYNIVLNNVNYVYMFSPDTFQKIITTLNIKKIFIKDFTYFMISEKKEDQKVFYIHDKLNLSMIYENQPLQDNGIALVKNFIDKVDEIIVFSEFEKDYIKTLTTKRLRLSSYVFNLDDEVVDFTIKENFIVSYDFEPAHTLNYFQKNYSTDYKLVLFNDNIKVSHPNVIVLPRNILLLVPYLKKSKGFITTEYRPYTHYICLLAIRYSCIVTMPLVMKELSNSKKILLGETDKEKINDFVRMNKEIYTQYSSYNKIQDL